MSVIFLKILFGQIDRKIIMIMILIDKIIYEEKRGKRGRGKKKCLIFNLFRLKSSAATSSKNNNLIFINLEDV